VKTGAPSKFSEAGNHGQPLSRTIQCDMEVGPGEFLVVTGAKGKRPTLESKLLSANGKHTLERYAPSAFLHRPF